MQNKPNLPDTQMNASYVKTKNYEQKTMDNELIKQSQTKPIYGELVEPIKANFYTKNSQNVPAQ